ncbi:hypothetical protein SH449x_004232 [Pirellulaceae bacterium SH449]
MASGFIAGWIVLLGSFSGCQPSTASVSDSGKATLARVSQNAAEQHEKDLGVIFIDEASYVAFPLADLGLDSDGEITSLSSSCDCVVPSVCEVQRSLHSAERVLRLDFRKEAHSSGSAAFHPQNLGVIVNVQYASGVTQSVTFLMLHTVRSAATGKNAGGEA